LLRNRRRPTQSPEHDNILKAREHICGTAKQVQHAPHLRVCHLSAAHSHPHLKGCELDYDPIPDVYVLLLVRCAGTYYCTLCCGAAERDSFEVLNSRKLNNIRPHEIRVPGKRSDQRQKGCCHSCAARFLLNDLVDASPLLVGPRHLRIVGCHLCSPIVR
jgi:hypothetical protein